MKKLFLLVIFLSLCFVSFSQNRIPYIITNDYVNFNDSVLIDANVYLDSEADVSIVFLFGVNFKNVIIINVDDSNEYVKYFIKNDVEISIDTICCMDLKTYTIICEQNNHILLTSQHLSSNSNGYRYYIFKNNELISSFYSYHALNYFDLSDEDKERLKILITLIEFFDIE